jgi:uncharacterized protein YeeX (DUF496 family)
MDQKTFEDVYETVPKKLTEEQLKAQIVDLNRKLENYKLIASYAQDVIDFWPNMTMRTIRLMIPKMDALKEALGLVK